MYASILFKTWLKQSQVHLLFIFFSALLLVSIRSMAQGDLMIYPKRLVFDGSKRSQQLSLANSGKDTARYVISVVQIRMNEDGSFESIKQPDPGQNFADKNFRFFPRSVILGPNEAQTVKVQLIKTNELEPGEYRSHLYFRAESEKKPLGEENRRKDSTTMSVRLVPVFGISIPVIIRKGVSTLDIQLSKVSLAFENDTIPVLKMILTRSGNMSVYGDITVHHLSAEGRETLVGILKGMAVYTPTRSRQFRLLLDKNAAVDYHSGSLHVVFTDLSGRTRKIAQKQIYLH